MRKKKLVDSPTPFTDWVNNGAKEEEWQQFLRDKEEKDRKIRDRERDNDQETRKLFEKLISEEDIHWVYRKKHALAHA